MLLRSGSGFNVTASIAWDTTLVPDGRYEVDLILRDASGNILQQVPRNVLANNSVVWHSGTVPNSETWSAAQVNVIEANLIIPAGVTVTVAPGAIVKIADGARIIIQSGGILNAIGVNGASIIFTSLEDDTVGGDTNMDGGSIVPVPGDWNGISVQGSGQFNTNAYTEVLYQQTTQTGSLNTNQTWLGSSVYHVTGNIVVQIGRAHV